MLLIVLTGFNTENKEKRGSHREDNKLNIDKKEIRK
jgi:hypothetical protein